MNIPIVRRVLENNDRAAAQNRELFDQCGVACFNVLGGAGCGKTTLLEHVLPRLTRDLHVAVLEGDLTTTRDAERIAALDVPVVQLVTDGGCHLTATHVRRALDELTLRELDLLLIENVGNPICPANFDLGEHARLAVLAVTDGDDKPSKYPLLFRRADVVVLSKCDLLEAVNFDVAAAIRDVRRIELDVEIVQTDARSGAGFDTLTTWFREAARRRAVVA